MLIGRTKSVGSRVAILLGSALAITVVGVALAALGAAVGLWVWPPQPSSPLGIVCGLAAGGIVFFEMALMPRKWLRGRRLGATRVWMRWHIWLGLVCLPVVLVHAGFGFGGPLPAATLVLFLLVTLSGIWGLVMQQWLPQRLLAEVPGETVASQIDFIGDYHATEAERLIEGLLFVPPEAEASEPIVRGFPAEELEHFRDEVLLPYLRGGARSGSMLASRAETEQQFSRLRETLPIAARPALDRLRELTDWRRQWDTQLRLNFWLHNWLLVHLPLSVAMTGLMVLHAVRALKYW